ncbi:MAG TPA: hypothetical protein VLS89_06765 [Candidatus Nanopelagicales bacterium]|nr:hypothetical protein [Candidatus Nanopelagicales bacterium]
MILIQRGPEPTELRQVRDARVPALRALAAQRALTRDDIHGYTVVAEALWKAQALKCCYCESPVQRKHNDVEHFRPKLAADRRPGCAERHGYWWLSFTWENLLFSCPGCNRGGAKVDRFPLEAGSVALVAEEEPPGQEQPLLVDPCRESGVRHIEFAPVRVGAEERWFPRAREGSVKGAWTIDVCKLDREDLVDLFTAHVRQRVEPEAVDIEAAMRAGRRADVQKAHWTARLKLLTRRQPYVGLSYDALRYLVPEDSLGRWGLRWEAPG